MPFVNRCLLYKKKSFIYGRRRASSFAVSGLSTFFVVVRICTSDTQLLSSSLTDYVMFGTMPLQLMFYEYCKKCVYIGMKLQLFQLFHLVRRVMRAH